MNFVYFCILLFLLAQKLECSQFNLVCRAKNDPTEGAVLSIAFTRDEITQEISEWSFFELKNQPSLVWFYLNRIFNMEDPSGKLFVVFNQFCGQAVRILKPLLSSDNLSIGAQKVVANVISTLQMHFWYVRLRLQYQQVEEKTGANKAIEFHGVNLPLSRIDPSPLFNLTIVIPVPPFDQMIGCQTEGVIPALEYCDASTFYFSKSYLSWLNDIIYEAAYESFDVSSPIILLFATPVVTLNHDNNDTEHIQREQLLISQRQEIYNAQCDYLASLVSGMRDKQLENGPDPASSSVIYLECISILLPHSDTADSINFSSFDIRELAAEYAYSQYHTDYYFFPNPEQSKDVVQHHGWLRRLFPLVLDQVLYRHYGVAFLESAVRPVKNNTGGMIRQFISPFLSREHFNIFFSPSLDKSNRLTSYLDPVWKNDLLLYNIYSAFSSANVLFSWKADSMSGIISLEDEEFVLRANSVREHLRLWLNSNVYNRSPIAPDFATLFSFQQAAKEDNMKFFWQSPAFPIPFSFIHTMNPVFKNTLWKSLGIADVASSPVVIAALFAVEKRVNLTVSVDFSVSLPRAHALPTVSTESYQINNRIKTASKVAVITAIFGNYESTGKWAARQSEATDFFIFTDREDLLAPGWMIVTTPYHLLAFEDELGDEELQSHRNSLHNHPHPFNIAKFYKMQFHRIDLLEQYEMVIWVDGTVSITDRDMSRKMLDIVARDAARVETPPVMTVFEHYRFGSIQDEVDAANIVPKYNVTEWLGYPTVPQIQGMHEQLAKYEAMSFRRDHWGELTSFARNREQYGLWCTCFIAWDMTRPKQVTSFLNHWYVENRRHSTEDQVSFPFVAQALQLYPHSLPDEDVAVYGGHDVNSLFVKWDHGM